MPVDGVIANGVEGAADVDFIVDEVDENIGNVGLILPFSRPRAYLNKLYHYGQLNALITKKRN